MKDDTNYEDENLTSKFSNGDKDTFKYVFSTYYPPLCFFASKILGSPTKAEDLVMDVFTKIWQKKDDLKEINNISSFLYATVRNAGIDQLRKEKKQIFLEGSDEKDELNINEVLEAEEVYAQLLAKVYEQIELLPPQCRLIFKMLFIEGQTTQQIAERLKLSVQSVRNQKTRAIDILKLKIDPNLLCIVLIHLANRSIHLH
ncbi:RNA polymerase sigma-70 factor [Sphingobacterium sp.]|uniref:RNA polymerase sigma factor n=1 Tax=Sphingobacterium sp. TaxID=341027 RepID=UPI00289E85F9|nr:RNA polymerase sigma-70 factor [Sphingobacterium sp.]